LDDELIVYLWLFLSRFFTVSGAGEITKLYQSDLLETLFRKYLDKVRGKKNN
jgi:hypothetical protein